MERTKVGHFLWEKGSHEVRLRALWQKNWNECGILSILYSEETHGR